MKFKGVISAEGMNVLKRRFLPCLDKFGKQCYLLLTPGDVFFIQDAKEADGMQISARIDQACRLIPFYCLITTTIGRLDLTPYFLSSSPINPPQNSLFEPDSYIVESKADNCIAFTVSISLLLKAISAANDHDAQVLHIKLTTRAAPGPEPTQIRQRPMLLLNWHGESVGLGQELPVGDPLRNRQELNNLKTLSTLSTLCPFYVNIFPEINRITLSVDKLKPLATAITLTLTRHGDLHLTMQGTNITLGEGIPGFETFWEKDSNSNTSHGDDTSVLPVLHAVRMEDRLRETMALNQKWAMARATIEVSHLMKALHSAKMTIPERMLIGIRSVEDCGQGGGGGGGGSYVHIMFAYSHGADKHGKLPVSLFFKLPIKEDDDDL